ncbi:plant basic secretory protein [Schizophyllum commune Loenen D]|nr:plant basic secretory protein [Schizophyllum commune Loenen D]
MAPVPPDDKTGWPIPRLSIRVDDLAHEGAVIFFDVVDPLAALREAVTASFAWLYTKEKHPNNVECINLILRPMPGVAYTHGSNTDKEIHLSLDHIARSAGRARGEIMGVLVHELVHCFQYNAKGTAPGGLIEGIADFVRLNAKYAPPHWKRDPSTDGKWDAGYQTTGYFLDWMEQRYGDGTVREINEAMLDRQYDSHIFKEVTGRRVEKLWKIYCEEVGGAP